jgi:hypothetical protein
MSMSMSMSMRWRRSVLSDGMRAAMQAGAQQRQMVWADTKTELLAMGEQVCGQCGHQGSQLEFLVDGTTAGPLYEHRRHIKRGIPHIWPQPHTCPVDRVVALMGGRLSPDACPICAGCADC